MDPRLKILESAKFSLHNGARTLGIAIFGGVRVELLAPEIQIRSR